MDFHGNDGATLGLTTALPVRLGFEYAGVERNPTRATMETVNRWAESCGRIPESGARCRECLFRGERSEHWFILHRETRGRALSLSNGVHYTMLIHFVGSTGDHPMKRWVFVADALTEHR
jgi:hypothetical protein